MRLRTLSGRPYPIVASVHPQGVNFSVFSKSTTSVELMFFDGVDDARPGVVVPLDPTDNRTYHYWHVFVHGIVNAYWEPLTFELPPPAGVHQGWHRGIDTSLDPPEDICDGPNAAPFVDKTYRVEPRSIVLLFSVRANGTGQSQPLAASHTIQN